MIKELEVKVLNIDKREIEDKLRAVGAELFSKEYQINTIYDDDTRFIKNKLNGYLRIRETKNLITNESKSIFTLKRNTANEKLRENIETETIIKDDKALALILQHINLKPKHRGTKERISYKYENIRFDIDTWDKDTYPYPYLEIEVNCESDLEKALNLLKLNRDDVTTKSLGQLRMEEGLQDL